MSPMIMHGDTLVFEISSRAKNGSIVLAQIGTGFTVKRIIKKDIGFDLVPDNHLFPQINYSAEYEVKVCGILITIIRHI